MKQDPLSAENGALFHSLWSGALFDIINAVLKECAGWDQDDQSEMIYQIVKQLAIRYELIGGDGVSGTAAHQAEEADGNERRAGNE
jgi:hypothetical protein